MLLRRTFASHRQQANCFAQFRTISTKAARPAIAKAATINGRKVVDSTSSTTSSTSNSNSNGSVGGNTTRNRKLTPAAKAKAQASASRALREQLAAMGIKDGSTSSSEIAKQQQAEKDASLSSSTSVPLSSRKFNDAIAYATAESYDFKKLIGSGRLPAGWQMLEDDEVLYIPHWPHPSTSSTASSTSSLPTGGEVFVFQSGSYVTWGLSSDQSSRFLRLVLQGRAGVGGKNSNAEVDSYTTIGDEAMEYILAEDQ